MLVAVRRWKRAVATLTTALVAAAIFVSAPLASTAGADAWASPVESVDPGVRDSVVRIYLATLDRAPDDAGRDYWVGQYLDHLPLAVIAEGFMGSAEWRATYGDVDDATFVNLLYQNVFDRAPDDAGFRYWHGKLRDEGYPRSSLVVNFSESSEFVTKTGTASPTPPPPLPWPRMPANSGEGRRIIYGNSAQRIWMIDENGRIAHSHLVSGKAGVPRPGTYSVYSKSERAWAGHDGITMEWMVRFAHGDRLPIGFHAIPRDADGRPLQSESELGSYRSAGCVRQADHNAKLLYEWSRIGDPVVVLA